MRSCQDQLGRHLITSDFPERIVSLVPSQTELLFDLGLGSRVVGRTKFCVHPAAALKAVTIIGGTKKVDIKRVLALKPDLVLANKEENDQGQIEVLAEQLPVWVSDVRDLSQAIAMIKAVGDICNKNNEAEKLVADITESLSRCAATFPKYRVLYLIWAQPWMGVGADNFIHDMLGYLGLVNVLQEWPGRYPNLSEAEIQNLSPDFIFLSSEPYPFKEKQQKELSVICPNSHIVYVDGEMFSWYGSRLKKAAGYFRNIHEQLLAMF